MTPQTDTTCVTLRLFEHVYATYRPPEREREPRYAQAVGQRTLFQVVGVMTVSEGKHSGDVALMPRDLRDGATRLFPPRVPLAHVVDVELAPPEAGMVMHGGQALGMGGG
jgi:hypothetical protein